MFYICCREFFFIRCSEVEVILGRSRKTSEGSAVLEGLATPPFKGGDYWANMNHHYDIK